MLECKMCKMWQSKDDINRVPVAYYMRFVDSMADFFGNDVQIQFVGGEPLLKPDVLELIRHTVQCGFRTTLTTNAYLMDKTMTRDLLLTGIDMVVVSLDSLKPRVHDSLRGKRDVFKRVMKALKYLGAFKADKQSIRVVATIMNPNLDSLLALVDWVETQKHIEAITLQAIDQPFGTHPDFKWYEKEEYSFLWPEKEKVHWLIDQLIDYKKKDYKISNSIEQLNGFKRYFEKPETIISQGGCHLGYNALSVNQAGDISLCFAHEPLGTIMRDSIEDVWESEKAAHVRAQIKACTNNCKLMMNCFAKDADKDVDI